MHKIGEIDYRVHLDDLDFMGIISHHQWVKLMERFRTQLLKEPYKKLLKMDLGLVVAKITCEYKFPAKYDEALRFEVEVGEFSRSSFTVRHKAFNEDGKLLITEDALLVCIGADGRPARLPEFLEQESKAYEKSE